MSFYIDISSRLQTFSYHVCLDSAKMRAGEVIGILGPSGSGKTMTLRYLAGVMKPDFGRIVVNGKIFFDSDAGIDLKPQDRRTGYLFQNYALFPNMTVRENIECGIRGAATQKKAADRKGHTTETRCAFTGGGTRKIPGTKKKEWREKTDQMIRQMHLEGLEERKPCELSGGQQQRVALARILVGDPQIVLLDEPFSALDEYLRDQLMYETIGFLKKRGIPVFFVTHSRTEAKAVSTDIAILAEGRIKEYGKTDDLFRSPETEWGRILTGSSVLF